MNKVMPWQGTDPINWAAKMKDVPRKAINTASFKLFSDIVLRTPVDTGQARSNWLVSINEEDQSTIGAEVKVKKIKKRKGENAGKVVTKRTVKLERGANDTIRAGQYATLFAEGDDTIIIQNNLPYITTLEFGGYPQNPVRGGETKTGLPKTVNGFSRQAPAGMCGLALQKFEKHLEAAIKESGGS
jgi:hypothetical protein